MRIHVLPPYSQPANGQRSPAAAQNRISGRLVQRLLDGLFEC